MTDVLQFYAFSTHKDAGDGVGDVVANKSQYKKLNKIHNWRRMFSSFWSGDPFQFEGLHYLSYEHAYQAAKYKINGYEYAFEFCIESNSKLSKMVGKDVQKAGRKIELTPQEIEIWDANVKQIKQQIYTAKFTSFTRPGQALILTGNAMLINAGPRIKKIHCTRLESLRTLLNATIPTMPVVRSK